MTNQSDSTSLSSLHKQTAARNVFLLALGINVSLSVAKLAWGYFSHTLSLIAEGFHSLLDASSNLVGLIAVYYSFKPADHDHPYGHRKFEALGSVGISFLIFLTCFEIAGQGFDRLMHPGASHPHVTPTSYVIMGITLASNLFITWYERKRARELQNDLLWSDSEHMGSDSLVSASVIVSMVLVQVGVVWADTIVAFLVALLILKVGWSLIMSQLGVLSDEAVLNPDEVSAVVMTTPGVISCHKIRSRGLCDHVFVDLHIQVSPTLTVREGHKISGLVKVRLMEAFPDKVSEVLVHVEDCEDDSRFDGMTDLQ